MQLRRRFERARKAEDLAEPELRRRGWPVEVAGRTGYSDQSFGPLTLRDRGVMARSRRALVSI